LQTIFSQPREQNPKSAQGRRNAADLNAITDQAAALDMCFARMREIRESLTRVFRLGLLHPSYTGKKSEFPRSTNPH
jgi:hypothetical protein